MVEAGEGRTPGRVDRRRRREAGVRQRHGSDRDSLQLLVDRSLGADLSAEVGAGVLSVQ